MWSGRRSRRLLVLLLLGGAVVSASLFVGRTLGSSSGPGRATARKVPNRWVTAWGSSMSGRMPGRAGPAVTYREFAHLSIGGDELRVRLSNFAGSTPLVIDAATVAIRSEGGSLRPGTIRTLTMHGEARFTLAPGEIRRTDPVRLRVAAQQQLAISLYVAGTAPVIWHPDAFETEYATALGAGNHTRDVTGESFTRTFTSIWWVDAVDVLTNRASGTIVVLGDSLTDGAHSDMNRNDRWIDDLGRREDLLPAPSRLGVVNEGIAGNRLCTPTGRLAFEKGEPGLDRLGRDVFSQSSVRDVIVFLGTNDIRWHTKASTVIGCLERAIAAIHRHGFRAIGATLIPRDLGAGWQPSADDPQRAAVNRWIRTSGRFDAYIDFDAAVRWSAHPDQIKPVFRADPNRVSYLDNLGTHPNAAGYAAMANAIKLAIFWPRPPKRPDATP